MNMATVTAETWYPATINMKVTIRGQWADGMPNHRTAFLELLAPEKEARFAVSVRTESGEVYTADVDRIQIDGCNGISVREMIDTLRNAADAFEGLDKVGRSISDDESKKKGA